jgi:hypothetical protein
MDKDYGRSEGTARFAFPTSPDETVRQPKLGRLVHTTLFSWVNSSVSLYQFNGLWAISLDPGRRLTGDKYLSVLLIECMIVEIRDRI